VEDHDLGDDAAGHESDEGLGLLIEQRKT